MKQYYTHAHKSNRGAPKAQLKVSYYGDYEDFEYDTNDNWQAKARRLQVRRQRHLKHED